MEMSGGGRGRVGGRGGRGNGRNNSRLRCDHIANVMPPLEQAIGNASEYRESTPPILTCTVRQEEYEDSPPMQPSLNQSSAASCSTIKKGRGKYKCVSVDTKTKYGGKITINISKDLERAVGEGAREFSSYCGWVVRTTVLFRDGDWPFQQEKCGEVMWLKVKDKFEPCEGQSELSLKHLTMSTLQRLFRNWKTKLHDLVKLLDRDEDRRAIRPSDVHPIDWEWLLQHWASEDFKAMSDRNKLNRGKQMTKHTCSTRSFAEVEHSLRDPITGEPAGLDVVWEAQHTRRTKDGETEWVDPKSQEIYGCLHELVLQQQSSEVESRMTGDEILSTVLGIRSGFVRGKGYGKKPQKKRLVDQVDVDHRVSSAIKQVREEMEQKREEDRAHMAQEFERKLQQERAQMAQQVQDEVRAQVAALLSTLQQQGHLPSSSNTLGGSTQ